MEHTLRGYIGLKKTPQSKERWRHTFHTKDRWKCSSLVSIPACQECGIRDEFVPCVDADLLWTLLAAAFHFRILFEFLPTDSSLETLSCPLDQDRKIYIYI